MPAMKPTIPTETRSITGQGGTVVVTRHGGHLLSWRPNDQEEVLWLSSSTNFAVGSAIRGGIPICWPWFGPHVSDKTKPQHGFARNALWDQLELHASTSPDQLAFALPELVAAAAGWPGVRLEFRVDLTDGLVLELETTNAGDHPVVISEALHTYFHVGELTLASVAGLDGVHYRDNADGGAIKQQAGPVTFDGHEIVRIYSHGAGATLTDPSLGRRIHIAPEGAQTMIVWNPGRAKIAAFADIPTGEVDRFVCIESGTAGAATVSLPAGARHSLRVRYRVEIL